LTKGSTATDFSAGVGSLFSSVVAWYGAETSCEKGSDPFSAAFSETETVPDPIPESEQNPASPDEKSVAVLPFVNMSSDPEQEFFSDGISEEILNVLTRIPGLKVAARTSSFQFKGQNQDIADIARQLRVNHVLEGSVRKSGDRIRITAQLIEAATGFHVWSDTFDRQLQDVFAIQDEIASAIAGELRTRLAGQSLEASTPVDMAAYELYLKGRALVATRRDSNLMQAIELLQQALKVAPDYAPAMASMATAYVVLPYFSEQIPTGTARREARNWAEKALSIEPDNSEALAVMGIVYNELELDPAKALESLQRAVAAHPGSAVAHNFLGDIYTRVGDLDQALVHEAKAAELDPLGPVQLTDLGNVYALKGDFQKVLEMADRALELDPEFLHALIQKTDINFILGDREEFELAAERMFRASDIRSSDLDGVKTQRLLMAGEFKQARTRLEQRLDGVERGDEDPATLSFEAILLGDFDTAGRLLLTAYRQGNGTWAFPLWVRMPEQAPDSEPWQAFWALPGPTRFAALRRQNGFYPYAPKPPGVAKP